MAIIMKQIKGRTKLRLTAGKLHIIPQSIIIPCNGGINAPPTIAMTRKAAPSVESSELTFSKAMP